MPSYAPSPPVRVRSVAPWIAALQRHRCHATNGNAKDAKENGKVAEARAVSILASRALATLPFSLATLAFPAVRRRPGPLSRARAACT